MQPDSHADARCRCLSHDNMTILVCWQYMGFLTAANCWSCSTPTVCCHVHPHTNFNTWSAQRRTQAAEESVLHFVSAFLLTTMWCGQPGPAPSQSACRPAHQEKTANENGNFQKSTFFHIQKVLFHTFKKNSYPQICFHTFKLFFILCKTISYPYTKISYLMKIASYR